MGLALVLLACTATATTEASSALDLEVANLVSALKKLGPDTELSAFILPNVNIKGILAVDKITLVPVPDAPAPAVSIAPPVRVSSVREIDDKEEVDTPNPNADARAIFSWLATDTHIIWKLSLFDIEDFTGAHLHLNTPAGPIVQHLVPELAEGDFIAPIDIPDSKLYVGSSDTSELKNTLGVTSIRKFITDFVSQNEIYINVHGPENAAILRGFLNA
ncbi:hypothetical protein Ndes2526B_g03508 [Nannochloris sp. 'desiccata']